MKNIASTIILLALSVLMAAAFIIFVNGLWFALSAIADVLK